MQEGQIEDGYENIWQSNILDKETIDKLLDTFKQVEFNDDMLSDKYQCNKKLLETHLTSLEENEFRMSILLTIQEQNKLRIIEKLRKERIKTKITNLCRNELGIIEKLDIQRPVRAENKKKITADVWVEFEDYNNFIRLLKNAQYKVSDCKIIVRKRDSKQSTNNTVKKNTENTKSIGKYLLRFRQEIQKPKKIKNSF